MIRDRIARIIDPEAFAGDATSLETRRNIALDKADQIHAMPVSYEELLAEAGGDTVALLDQFGGGGDGAGGSVQ